MKTWKHFDANEVTHSVSHHLLAIYELGQEYGGWARVSDIARRLDITRGSVSINLRGIKTRGLVVEDDRRQVKLSPKGLKIAHDILAKKTAIKAFLHKVLGLSEEQAEVDSCKIEHLLSTAMAERLVHFVKLALSDDAAAQTLLGRVRKFKEPCRDGKPCPVCKDHCLLEQLSAVL